MLRERDEILCDAAGLSCRQSTCPVTGLVRVTRYIPITMPFVQRAVGPVHLSRVKLHDEHGVPTVRDRELDAVTNCALSNALRQMASVAALADEVFRELRDQLADVATRSAGLKRRVQALSHLVDHADPKAVTVRKSKMLSTLYKTFTFSSGAHRGRG